MPGVADNLMVTPSDRVFKEVADDMGGRHVPPDAGGRVLRREDRREGEPDAGPTVRRARNAANA